MKISEALAHIDNAIEYWSMNAEYEGKDQDEQKTFEAFDLIVKATKKNKE
tara:strand:- start:168 stop:317 length:150 start_codon:yes stop_codon:yes gene_type:complete